MSETLFVEVDSQLIQVPQKGDIISLSLPYIEDKIPGICLEVDVKHRVANRREPQVKMLLEGQIYYVPLKYIEISQNAKK